LDPYSIFVPVPQEFEYLGSVDFNLMFRILIDMRYRSLFYSKKLCFQWAEGFFAETLMGLFGEQGEVAEEVAGGSAQADPTPLAPAPFHPEEVP
jgi:hypothetical protein